ncbi:MAG: Stk1 family PASTA domain-containing Ser/Thr kinase [Jatrophihabitans sp.]
MTQPRLVGARYELGELIGYGGMAEVHRGRDTRLNRDVAIKVLRPDLARDPSFLNRFRREAHSAAGLNHPSIVAVYDTGEDVQPDGSVVPFIVMEFVEGRTLRDILKSEGRLPDRRAMEVTADICSALEFSHRNGIIHRDIKPANVMITSAGAVKVMDFGIARAVADTSSTVTQTANVIGTAQYLSPEQARGESVDARSDVYSTGCLLYELVCGVPPFQGDSPVAVAYQHVRENPVAPSARVPEIPRAIDSIVMKALAKNQLNRYQSAGEMRADLQRALADQPVTAESVMTDAERTQFIARTPPPVVAPRRPVYEEDDQDDARKTGLIWAAVVIALLLVIGVGTFLIFGSSNSDTKKTVTLGSVIGQTPAAAEASLRKQHLLPKRGPVSNGPCTDKNGTPMTVAEGNVCVTSPAPGMGVKQDSTVVYRLYMEKKIQVPFVEGMPYAQASQTLAGLGLKVKKQDVFQSDGKGTVLHQSVPQTSLVLPGSSITLLVSTGTVKLPDVKGKASGEAISTLNGAGFTVISMKYTTTTVQSKDTMVQDEYPTAKVAYPTSQKITLTIYKYKPKPPACTTAPPSPSFTPPSIPGLPPPTTSPPPTSTIPTCPSTTPTSPAPTTSSH